MNAIEIISSSAGKALNASTFLEFLRLSNDRWWRQGNELGEPDWVFRGVPDAGYSLTPSGLRALRKDSSDWREQARLRLFDRVEAILGPAPALASPIDHFMYHRRLWREFICEGLISFLNLARDHGLPIEGGPFLSLDDRGNFGRDYSRARAVLVGDWGLKIPYDLWSLAQHHGIPTFLLDWTFDPIIAAFFACEGRQPDDPKDIAVWAFNERIWKEETIPETQNSDGLPKQEDAFRDGLIRPRRDQNQYLLAQRGVFTWIDGNFDQDQMRWLGADEMLNDFQVRTPALRKVVLAGDQVPDLNRLLRREGISRAGLMPTLDNIALTARDRW